MALPRRRRSLGKAENRGLCGPACQKYFHVSDKVDKGSSVRENGWVHLKLHITRGSISFVLEKSFCHTVLQTLQPQLLQLTMLCIVAQNLIL